MQTALLLWPPAAAAAKAVAPPRASTLSPARVPLSLALPRAAPSTLAWTSRPFSPLPLILRRSRRPAPQVKASAPAGYPSPEEDAERVKLAQAIRTLEKTSRILKRFGNFGFWSQLVCTIVSAVILSFSTIITGRVTAPFTFYATSGGIVAAFISVFWSFGYLRLAEKLRTIASEPSKAPPRAEVVNGLKNGIVLNLLGMGAAILGMQATVGALVGKALTTSSVPYYQGISPGQSPVLALDVFLVQASANTILSHFLGLCCSLELLRSLTPQQESAAVPRPA